MLLSGCTGRQPHTTQPRPKTFGEHAATIYLMHQPEHSEPYVSHKVSLNKTEGGYVQVGTCTEDGDLLV